MQFDWGTFFLEAINFLILVWILKRFLYQPVMDAVQRRKESVDLALSDAQAAREQAETLNAQYENRIVDWEREKDQARAELREELTSERSRQLTSLQQLLAQEREKSRVLDERRQHELLLQLQHQAIGHGGHFVAGVLERMASPELENRIIDLAMKDLMAMPSEKLQEIGQGIDGEPVLISTAFDLTPDRRRSISQTLSTLSADTGKPLFKVDSALICVIRISAGPWVLRANLEDELDFFTEASIAGC